MTSVFLGIQNIYNVVNLEPDIAADWTENTEDTYCRDKSQQITNTGIIYEQNMSYSLDKSSAKILVLGDSGVGKSSLIHLICHSTILSSAQWTIGCSIDVKIHDNHFLEFWDIGGSRSHSIARPFLYQDYHGIMLVFDATNKKSRVNLDVWLKEVTQRTNDTKDLDTLANLNVPIVTIATKKDLCPYGSISESSDITTNYSSKDCSIVNFNEAQDTNYPYRRQISLSPQMRLSSSPIDLFPAHSASRNSSWSSRSDEQLIENQVIFVNTQDVLSFSTDSQSYKKLNNFFKCVIDRRNKKVYNKFAT